MIKKLIPISVILALAMTIGLVGVANAAWNSVQFTANTPTGVSDLIITSGSKIEQIVIGGSTITITLASGSTITFTSASGQEMVLNDPIATVAYAVSGSSLAITYVEGHPTVVVSLTGKSYAPIISALVVTNTTTVTVTFDKSIDYVFDSTALIAAGTRFAGVAPTSTSISGAALTLTFASGALKAAGVKDDSVLVLPAGQIKEYNRTNTFLGTSTQVVTTLSTINQLYDFTFAVQEGQNFMSIPYDVVGPDGTAVNTLAKVAATYVVPASKTISTQTIGDAGGNSANASSFSVLYGYYINTDVTSDVYLRLNKASSQSSTFERTLTATGWHLIGVASNNVAATINNDTDDDILSTIGSNYDRVVDIAIGRSGDDNANANPDYTYDASVGTNLVYRALLIDANIVTKTKAQIDSDTLVGIEFNHGEAYFIYITAQNARYIGDRVASGNLVK